MPALARARSVRGYGEEVAVDIGTTLSVRWFASTEDSIDYVLVMVGGASRGGSYAVGRERRERILDAATERFTQAGYGATSLADIARDVGLTTPGLTHHFPTKQHLLLAIAERRFEMSATQVKLAPPDTDGTGPLRTMLGLAETFMSQPGLMELFVLVASEASDTKSAAHELYKARYEGVIVRLTARFQAAVAAGHLRPDLDYERIARECIAVSDGLQLQWVLTGGAIDFVGMIRDQLERLAPFILLSGAKVDLSTVEQLDA